jgi:hypothetical protein
MKTGGAMVGKWSHYQRQHGAYVDFIKQIAVEGDELSQILQRGCHRYKTIQHKPLTEGGGSEGDGFVSTPSASNLQAMQC